MEHLPPIIFDLAVILGAAAISTLIFSKLKQPIVLGYLIAGFAVGPHFPLWPTVVDSDGVMIWAEIGVIFLLFALGLEFSFKKLAKVGKSAFISTLFEILTISALGYLFGKALGWTTMDSIYLGAILSMSSTAIIIRAFGEAGLKERSFASLVFGILIVQDLIAILMMVILSAISGPGSFSSSEIAYMSGRLIFFLLIWFIIGIYVLPTFLKRVRGLLSNEIMLIVSISLCFCMVVLATEAKFSAALGAFIMGSILAETEEGERIERLLISVRDLFAAVFFVSVGMMIDPNILVEYFWVILLISFITIVGKLLGTGFGAVLSGRSLKDSTQAGMSLAQIGEFSFIIAGLGVSLNVVSHFLYPIVIAISAVTTFTTPYMIRYSEPFYFWLESKLPKVFLQRVQNYEKAMASSGKDHMLMLLWKNYGPLMVLNAVVALAISLISSKLVLPLLLKTFDGHIMVRFLACVVTLTICSPFLFAMILKDPKKKFSDEPLTLLRVRRLQFGIVILRALLGLLFIELIINQFSSTKTLPLVILITTPLIIYFFRGWIEKLYFMVESRFLNNLNAKERAELEKLEKLPQLAPWGANLITLTMSSDSPIAGQTLEECKLRTVTGVTVGMIDRGSKRIFAPDRSTRLLPNDELFLVGVESQLSLAQKLVQPSIVNKSMIHDEMFNLESFLIEPGSPYVNKIIRAIGLGEDFGGLIVGIERGGERMLNPESSVILEAGDLVWVFGQINRIREFQRISKATP